MVQHIVIVGGGIGGTMTANHLVTKLYPEIRSGKVRVTLLSNSPWHYYKPAFMYVAFDAFFRDELRRPQISLYALKLISSWRRSVALISQPAVCTAPAVRRSITTIWCCLRVACHHRKNRGPERGR